MIIKSLAKYSHTSWVRGYVSRKSSGYIERYIGRFGIGCKYHTPSYDSTIYHLVSYYLIPGVTKKDVKVFESDYSMSDVIAFMSKCGVRSDSNSKIWYKFCELAKFLGIKIIPEVKEV